jgi:hypothetical protein
MKALALLLTALALAACTPPPSPPPPAEMTLSLRPKGSCILSGGPVLYTTQCLAALQLTIERNGLVVSRSCTAFDGENRVANLGDLVNKGDAVRFATWANQGTVVFKLRGIHDAALPAGADPCDPDVSQSQWLLWGESAPTDLGQLQSPDASTLAVDIPIDCRDCARGCDNLGDAQCPTLLPSSYCVPFAAGFSCERRCDDDEECFEGAVSCSDDTGRCAPSLGTPGDGLTGEFCFPCRSNNDCDPDYFCVAAPGQSEGLCTQLCPLRRCLRGATCRRVGSNLVVLRDVVTDAGPTDGGS